MENSAPFYDAGLWIDGVPEPLRDGIKASVFDFRARHNLSEDAWHIRVFGWPERDEITAWLWRSPIRALRQERTFHKNAAAVAEFAQWLEDAGGPPRS